MPGQELLSSSVPHPSCAVAAVTRAASSRHCSNHVWNFRLLPVSVFLTCRRSVRGAGRCDRQRHPAMHLARRASIETDPRPRAQSSRRPQVQANRASARKAVCFSLPLTTTWHGQALTRSPQNPPSRSRLELVFDRRPGLQILTPPFPTRRKHHLQQHK